MATFIYRTNPDYDAARATFKCAACRAAFISEDEARACALADHRKRGRDV